LELDCRNIVEEKLPDEEDLNEIPSDIFVAEETSINVIPKGKSSESEFVLTKDKKVDIVTNQIIEMLLLDMENGKQFSLELLRFNDRTRW